MSDTIIKVENLSKRFIISHEERERYTSLRDVITRQVKSTFSIGRKKIPVRSSQEEFWALKDLNFEIKRGDRVGIIGRNGAGKSTLLKILSRITEPTTGRITIDGRVASLLEVGTGFHPELTGRENIFLNGAILGMSRGEIKSKFDEIVAFAEVEQFLDTPVKRYSSGMYVRLAFAVAAHLEPEILIVDEVLAVGDAQFQKKCLGKMKDVSEEGRTVIFVSHSMSTISSLCNRVILLDGGKIKADGDPSTSILSYYTSGIASPTSINYAANEKSMGDGFVRLLRAEILSNSRSAEHEVSIIDEIEVNLEYEFLKDDPKTLPYPNIHVYNFEGICVFVAAPSSTESMKKGRFRSSCKIPGNFLNEGSYFIGVAISSFGRGVVVHVFDQNALSFNVKDHLFDVPTRLQVDGEIAYSGEVPGTVRPLLDWQTIKIL